MYFVFNNKKDTTSESDPIERTSQQDVSSTPNNVQS